MNCTHHLWKFQWQHHTWRPRVVGCETLSALEPNMWARDVVHEYARCDKQEVCEVCGAVGRTTNCICDMARAEACTIRLRWIEESRRAGE